MSDPTHPPLHSYIHSLVPSGYQHTPPLLRAHVHVCTHRLCMLRGAVHIWGCSGVMCTRAPPCSLLIHALVRNRPRRSHAHTRGVGPCLLLLYGQSISWSAEAHGVQRGGSAHVCTEDAGAAGKLLKLN